MKRLFIYGCLTSLTILIGVMFSESTKKVGTIPDSKISNWNETIEYQTAKKLDNTYFGNCKQFANYWKKLFPNAVCNRRDIGKFGHYECILKTFDDKIVVVDSNYHLDNIIHIRVIER